jgi:hypothetical protein
MPTTRDRKIIEEVRDVMRLHYYSIHTTMIYTHVLQQSGQGVQSPLEDLDI